MFKQNLDFQKNLPLVVGEDSFPMEVSLHMAVPAGNYRDFSTIQKWHRKHHTLLRTLKWMSEIAVVFFCLKKSLVEEIQHIQHSTWCSVVCHPLETYVKS